jgi:hypothetical protein
MATLKSQSEKQKQEIRDRLLAVKHIKSNQFSQHTKLEGYVGSTRMEHMFACDRLLSMESTYSRIQMGFNPNRRNSFIIMNLRSSKYDTITSQYQKQITEEQMNPVSRSGFQNRVLASKKGAGALVMIEKSEARPWGEHTIRPHYGKGNSGTIQKAMPFFSRDEEKAKLISNRRQYKQLQRTIQKNIQTSQTQQNTLLRRQQTEIILEDNQLAHIIQVKETESLNFFNKINHSYEPQKRAMFEYYRSRRMESSRERSRDTAENAPPTDEENQEE